MSEFWNHDVRESEAALQREAKGKQWASSLAEQAGSALPSHCEKHPTAMIRHSWNESYYILNGLPSGEGIKSEHAYECAECGRPLAEPNS